MSQHRPHDAIAAEPTDDHPFRALWVMMVGFFLIVVDSTVIAVANPVLKNDFDVEYHSVIWVTSGYLLAFAAFLLIGGRLGDRFGSKPVYLVGLTLFAAASVWCGLSTSVGMLIAARVAQGVGAALLTPQIMSTITRTFPPQRHGMAMSVWGATAGVGMLAGPLIGGVLLAGLGWQWIFFVNAPIGAIGIALAVRLVPNLPGRPVRIDVVGALLSGAGICLIVLGLQEGQHERWSWWIWVAIAGGLVSITAFLRWQTVHADEPLIPMSLMSHRNFVLSTAGIALVSFVFVSFGVPLMIYLQEVCGLSPVHAALLTAPMAVATAVLAPVVGRIVDRAHPRPVVGFGFGLLTAGLIWLAVEMTPDTPAWRLALPLTMVGAAGAFTWEPLSAIATRGLTSELAGAGSAVCNTARHVGAALSSAGIAALMAVLLGDEHAEEAGARHETLAPLVDALKDPFAGAMAQSMLLPAAAAAMGVLTALFLVGGDATARAAPLSLRPWGDASVSS